MARTARIFASIDVHYFEDDRVLAAGAAWQLHLAAILHCKRTLSDGGLTRRQLARIAPESLPDIAGSIDKLIEVGLFEEWDDMIAIRSWGEWNDLAGEVEAMSKGGKEGNHVRWHVKRGLMDPACQFCVPRVESPPESPPNRGGSRRLDTDEDTYEDSGSDLDALPLADINSFNGSREGESEFGKATWNAYVDSLKEPVA